MKIKKADRARNMVKIHFKGYSEKFDEYRPWEETNVPVTYYQGPVARESQNVLAPGCRSKISSLMITELFYLPILNMNRGSLQARGFTLLRFQMQIDRLKMALRTRKVSGAFEKQVPEPMSQLTGDSLSDRLQAFCVL